MARLDGKFYGQIRKVKDDTIVSEDEYVVFLAKDNAFAAVLPFYRHICADMGCDPEQLAGVDRLIARVSAWREANADRCKKPDIEVGEKLLG
jgi:hypothetical protein